MNKLIIFLLVLISSASIAQKSKEQPTPLLDGHTYFLTKQSTDSTYGFTPRNPIKVGETSVANEIRFLNALLGPNGEKVKFFRNGSCCTFRTPNGPINKTGLLNHYIVYWEGGKDTLSIYINIYDKSSLQIPVGFTAKKK
jgi:hypothetical protein